MVLKALAKGFGAAVLITILIVGGVILLQLLRLLIIWLLSFVPGGWLVGGMIFCFVWMLMSLFHWMDMHYDYKRYS